MLARLLIGLALLAGLIVPPAAAQPASVWDSIHTSKVLHVGLIPNRPPYQWTKAGKNEGLANQMAEDLAAALSKDMGVPVQIEYVTTSWATLILDIQAGSVDVFFGMVATEERRKAIDMFGPVYAVPVVAVNRIGFAPGETWATYDNPQNHVAAVMGTADEAAAREFLPHVRLRNFKSLAEASLDIQSGNSDALVTSLLIALDAKRKNPAFANLTLLQPIQASPSGGGTPKDADGKFAAFTQAWSQEYRSSGRAQQVITEAITKAGLSLADLPQGVKF